MADAAYLLARLPRLYSDAGRRPMGALEFEALVSGHGIRGWCRAILDWLRIANSEAAVLKLPPPYPDAGFLPESEPLGGDRWEAYYRRLTNLCAPESVREWAREDAALISLRARARGAHCRLAPALVPRGELLALVESGAGSLAEAASIDRRLLRLAFARLEELLSSEPPHASARVIGYAIKMLLLARAGIPVEAPDAA